MEVKSTRALREFYKSNIKDTEDLNRSSHFAGSKMQLDGKSQKGFFEMINGPGEIDNKLATILGMAGDSQAIYEFMQNAVDADSKHFMLSLYNHNGKQYLVVLNDGKYFRLRDVVSILAIGDSSKFRNPDNIGQFGVGFKLAHRLIGADNSIRELLDENKGPILFSWSDGAFANLGNAESITTIDPLFEGTEEKAESKSGAPWLFKIVATNFPCLIEDEVWDARGNLHAGLFSLEEYDALKGAALQCGEEFDDCLSFQEGTMLLIPLFENKIKDVIGTIPKGLEIAATIIGHRAGKEHVLTTVIKREQLKPAPLEMERWTLTKEAIEGKLGNETLREAELMFLYGNPFSKNPFEGKPQFYRYFPMAEEQHGFRFAIHGNALSFSSARTALQESDPNRFLFTELIEGLKERFKEYALDNKERFQILYASILLSERAAGGANWKEGRGWLEEALWKPLMQLLQNHIPIKSQIAEMALAPLSRAVLLKWSRLPIENWFKESSASWFYWDMACPDYQEICHAALSKLHLRKITLADVILDTDAIGPLNRWLEKSPNHAHLFLEEFNEIHADEDKQEVIWKKFGELRLWWFDDEVYSIVELSSNPALEHYLIKYGPLHEANDALSEGGINVSMHSLDGYKGVGGTIRTRNQGLLPYLVGYENLNVLISKKLIHADNLSPTDRQSIFKAIEKATKQGTGGERQKRVNIMKPLAVFRNKKGITLPLEQLIGSNELPQMLLDWRMSEGDTTELNLNDYVAATLDEVYEKAILSNWESIAAQDASPAEREELFSYLLRIYKQNTSLPKFDSEAIFFGEDGTCENAFYHQSLQKMQQADYTVLATAIAALGIGNLPQYGLLRFYEDAPFILPPAAGVALSKTPKSLVQEEAIGFFNWTLGAFPKLFSNYLIIQEGEEFQILKRPENLQHYTSSDKAVKAYAENYLSEELLLLPEEFASVLKNEVLHGEKLLSFLIKQLHIDVDEDKIVDLAKIILEHGSDAAKKSFLEQMIPIELTQSFESESYVFYVIKVCFEISNKLERRNALKSLTGITQDGIRIPLAEIDEIGSDDLKISHPKGGELDFSVNELLDGQPNTYSQLLTQTASKWVALKLGSDVEVADALGIYEAPRKEAVLGQMLLTLEDGRLKNAAQFAFVLLMEDALPAGQNLQIGTIEGWQDLKGTFYTNALPFVPNKLLIDEKYKAGAVQLLGTNPEFKAKLVTIFQKSYFEETNFILQGVEHIECEEQSQFWRFLYEEWKFAGRPVSITVNEGNDWKPFLGVNPSAWVIVEDVALPKEIPTYEILDEYGISEKDIQAFIQALGANGRNSPLVEVRQGFKKETDSFIPATLPVPQILSTLEWLHHSKTKVYNNKISGFYQNLHRAGAKPMFFPGFRAGDQKTSLVHLNEKVFFVNSEIVKIFLEKSVSLKHVANTAQTCIIAQTGALQDWRQYLEQNLENLPVQWKVYDWEKANTEASEWKDVFYCKWQEAFPHFRVLILQGEMPLYSTVAGKAFNHSTKGKVTIGQDSNVVYVAGGMSTERVLDCLEQELVFTQSAREALRKAYTEQSESFKMYLSLAEADTEFAELLAKSAENAQLKADRQRISTQVNQSDNYYTLEWFQNLLELVRTQERSVNVQGVTFSKCKRVLATEKIYELSHYEGRVPANIGHLEEISATISYKNKEGKLQTFPTKIEASLNRQKVTALFPEPRAREILKEEIISVELNFTNTVDLIDELKRGYERLGAKATDSLKDTLSPNIDFLFGPPGTGKTTKLAEGIISRAEKGHQGPTIVLTPTNKAADVLTKKIIELAGKKGKAPKWLVRAGTCTEPSIRESDAIKLPADLIIAASSQTVLITTIHRFPYFTVLKNATSSDKIRLCDCPWAKVIFDEASMIPLPYIVYAIQARQRANENTHFLIAGDPLQIPPVFDLIADDLDDTRELEKHNIYSMIALSSFDEEQQRNIPKYGNRIINLTEQHRSISAIGNVFSNFQYGGRITHSRGSSTNKKSDTSRELPKAFSELGFKPLTVIRFPVFSEDSIYQPKKLQQSPFHLYASLLISELIKSFRLGIEQEEHKGWTVGVLSPYRAQAEVLQKMIEAHHHQSMDLTITTDTVHGFQGDENALVFAVLNPSSPTVSYSRFLDKEFILNVAVSRAEDYLVLLVPDEKSKGIDALSNIQKIITLVKAAPKELYTIMEAKELEAKLMGKAHYFENNSFSSAHQKVNVYGVPQMPYTIRLSGDSLDVHWKDL